MTGTLQLSVHVADAQAHLTSGVAVRIESLTGLPSREGTWTVLVPTGVRGLPVEVPAGSYDVQAWLPSGRIMRQAATVADGSAIPVEFRERWRKKADAVASAERSFDLHKEFDPSEFQPAFSQSVDPFGDDVPLVAIDIVHERPSALSWSSFSLGEDLRSWLADDTTPTGGMLGGYLAVHSPEAISMTIDRGVEPTLSSHRHWVRLEHEFGTSLGALPLPWLASEVDERQAAIEVNYGRPGPRLEITVRDGTLDTFVAYLKLGRLSAAELSIDILSENGTILRALQGKGANPLAACAAAYVSLAVANAKQIDVWRQWAPNLMNRFPWMPDGAIVRACVLMNGPVSQQSRDEILNSAKIAFARGLPFFTVGIRHLREMLAIFGTEDEEARAMLKAVRVVSSRCDVAEAFTTLQFPSS